MIHNSPSYPAHNLCNDFLAVGHLGEFQESTIFWSFSSHKTRYGNFRKMWQGFLAVIGICLLTV